MKSKIELGATDDVTADADVVDTYAVVDTEDTMPNVLSTRFITHAMKALRLDVPVDYINTRYVMTSYGINNGEQAHPSFPSFLSYPVTTT